MELLRSRADFGPVVDISQRAEFPRSSDTGTGSSYPPQAHGPDVRVPPSSGGTSDPAQKSDGPRPVRQALSRLVIPDDGMVITPPPSPTSMDISPVKSKSMIISPGPPSSTSMDISPDMDIRPDWPDRLDSTSGYRESRSSRRSQ